jgi:dolichol-phosphate mannosyltransferase
LQDLSGAAEGLVHPALLATLVYRFGIPGRATTRSSEVQANGQCFLVQRDVLERCGGFQSVRDSLCEDVTLARRIAIAGHPVGFYETDRLVSVAMYAGWRDAWQNWTRSLPMRDRYWGGAGVLGLAEVTLVQALPLALASLLWRVRRDRVGGAASGVNAALLTVRLGTLAGMARAYRHQPWTYWFSPLVDLPVAAQLLLSATRRKHVWRGRPIIRGGTQ